MKKKASFINNIQISYNIIFKILNLLLLLNPILNECDKETPILKNSICILIIVLKMNLIIKLAP